jgi:SAM-dependent methyltransferase
LYDVIGQLDGTNYSATTVWNKEMKEGEGQYRYGDGKTGTQLIQEASDLNKIGNGNYDFLLASHVLEHCADAIKTIEEWKRVVKDDGYLLIVLPHKEGTFDHKRPVTQLKHFIEDYQARTKEDDMTHRDEILKLHDLMYDKGTPDVETLKERSSNNIENRCMHHHVFNGLNAAMLIDYTGLKIIDLDVKRPYHIVLFTQKTKAKPDNSRFLVADYYSAVSPFGI